MQKHNHPLQTPADMTMTSTTTTGAVRTAKILPRLMLLAAAAALCSLLPASEAVRSLAAGGHTPLEPPEVIPGTTAWQPPVFLNTFKMVAMLDWPGWEVTTTGANTAPVTIARTGDHLGIYYKAQVWNSCVSDTPSGDLVFWERSLVWKTYSDID